MLVNLISSVQPVVNGYHIGHFQPNLGSNANTLSLIISSKQNCTESSIYFNRQGKEIKVLKVGRKKLKCF